MAEERDPQLDRAIRRAAEATAGIKRPADWTPNDYRRFEAALRENGFALRPVKGQRNG